MSDAPRTTRIDRPYGVLLAFIALIVVAGGNAVAVRFTIRELAPFWSATLRFTAAASVFFVLMVVQRVPFSKGRALVGDVVYGVMSFGVSYALFYWGVQQVSAGVAQVILALVPLFTVFLAALHGLERVTIRGLVGALLSLAGFLVIFRDQLSIDVPVPSLIALLVASVVVAESTVVVKWFPRSDPVAKNAVGMAAGSLVLMALSLMNGEPLIIPLLAPTWISLTYLVLPGSVLVFTLFLYVLNRWTASASSYQFVLLPFATVFYGVLLLEERLTTVFALGAALVLAGVYAGGIARQTDRKGEALVPCLPEQPSARQVHGS